MSLDDLDKFTEPPVADFDSGFIGAADDDLWRTLANYQKEEAKRDRGTSFCHCIVAVLDEASVTSDTIRMLYIPQHGGDKTAWRVDFKYVCGVTPHLPRDEEVFMDPNMRDENGVLDLQKIHDTMGSVWPPPE